MRLKITHRTEYRYDRPVHYALQRLRLVPCSSSMQTVRTWSLSISGAREEVCFQDHFGNDTRLVSVEGEPHMIAVEASGEVETHDRAGVAGLNRGFAPLWLFEHPTEMTTAGDGIQKLAHDIEGGADIGRLHHLLSTVRDRVAYTVGATHSSTTAEEALAQGSGVCQDHAHVFIAAARLLGFPARYVSGYLMLDASTQQAASHAWAEAHVGNLGWVSFDPANGISPDERYVRLAVGRDYRDAMPVSGIRLGAAEERLAVHVTVEQ